MKSVDKGVNTICFLWVQYFTWSFHGVITKMPLCEANIDVFGFEFATS